MFEIGTTLREARRRQGLDLPACEAATKIRARYLTAMEEERFEVLPEPAYVRGFLRTYAEFLGVDSRLVLEEYASREGGEPVDEGPPPPPETAAGPIGGAMRRLVAPRPRRPRRSSTLRWLALGGVLVVALLVWAGIGGNSSGPITLPRSAPPPAASPAALAARAAHRAESPPARSRPPALTAPVHQAGATLQVRGLAGTRGSYVLVRRGGVEGPVVYEGTVAAGASMRWHDPRGLWIRVGWTPSLRAVVNGRPVALRGGTANFTIDDQGSRPAA